MPQFSEKPFSREKTPQPDKTSGLLWFLFSGTATVSAFILPIHFWALGEGYGHDISSTVKLLYFFTLYFCGLFHSLYRVKTIFVDLGLKNYKKIIGAALAILFLIPIGLLGWWVLTSGFLAPK